MSEDLKLTYELFFFILGRPTLVGKALSFTHQLSVFISFYQSTVLSRRADDGHQMYYIFILFHQTLVAIIFSISSNSI